MSLRAAHRSPVMDHPDVPRLERLRGRRARPDELTRALRRARRLWEAFVSACNERDRRLRGGNVDAAEAYAVTAAQADDDLQDVEARIRRLDEAAV
jgi:hypothetical protein